MASSLEDRVRKLFGLSIEEQMLVAENCASQVASAGERLAQCLLNDNKILICGHGGSAANAQHFTSALLNQYEVERPSLPAIALTADSAVLTGSGAKEQLFAKQVQALGMSGDILIALTTSGNSSGILHAIDAATSRDMDTIVLSGFDGGVIAKHLGPEDIEIRVPGESTARMREHHLFILHCFCDLIDQTLFGVTEE